MGLELREAKKEELPETVEIYIECVRGDYTFMPASHRDGLDSARELSECEDWLYHGNPGNRIIAAYEDDRMVGYVAVGRNLEPSLDYAGEVSGFFMRKAYRGQGIGLKLLRAGVRHLQDLGYRRVLAYNYRLSASNRYYRSLGGKLVKQEVQHAGGLPLDVEVFGWEIEELLSTLEGKLAG